MSAALRRRRRRVLLGLAVVAGLVIAGVAGFVVLRSDGEPAGDEAGAPAPALGELGPMSVEVDVELTRPDGDDAVFSGAGVVVPADDVAELTFDVAEVPNAAGFWGHHDALRMVYEGASALAEVAPGQRSWLQIEPAVAGPATGSDIARMREMFLANPALALALLDEHSHALGHDGGTTYRGEVPLTGELAPLAESFGRDTVEIAVSTRGDGIDRIVETWSFPVVPGADAEVEVVITFDFGDAEDVTIDVPAAGRRQSLQEMLDS